MLALIPRQPAGKRSGASGTVDMRGALLVTIGIAALIFGLSSGQQHRSWRCAVYLQRTRLVVTNPGHLMRPS